MHVELRAVGVERAIERCDRGELEPVGHVLADAVEGVGDEVGHREHGGAGIDVVGARCGVQLEATRAAAGHLLAFEDGDLASGTGEAHGCREPAEACADHDDAVGGSGDSAGHHTLLRVAA